MPPDGNIKMVNELGTGCNSQLSQIIYGVNQRVGLKLDQKKCVVGRGSLWSHADECWWAQLHIPHILF